MKYKIIQNKAENAGNSADRMGDYQVISLSFSKQLIEEAYLTGARFIIDFLKEQKKECSCAIEAESLLRKPNHFSV